MIPRKALSLAKRIGVFPSSANFASEASTEKSSGTRERIKSRFPANALLPATRASTPSPDFAVQDSGSRISIESSSALARIALASGCSLRISIDAASFKKLSHDISQGTISVTTGFPRVIVPVLSSATIRIRPASSKAVPVLKRIPFFAPLPIPTMMATGVARPSAHGQLTTRTAIAWESANEKSAPRSFQTENVTIETRMTDGTKTPETRSAIFSIGALVAEASLTIWMILESVVSRPTRTALHFKKPFWLSVAALTGEFASLSTGMLSPESADSSTADAPSRTTPSTGTLSPGFTIKTSPSFTRDASITVSTPSRITVAVLGVSFTRLFNASVVRPFDMDSRHFPRVISVTIIADVSK